MNQQANSKQAARQAINREILDGELELMASGLAEKYKQSAGIFQDVLAQMSNLDQVLPRYELICPKSGDDDAHVVAEFEDIGDLIGYYTCPDCEHTFPSVGDNIFVYFIPAASYRTRLGLGLIDEADEPRTVEERVPRAVLQEHRNAPKNRAPVPIYSKPEEKFLQVPLTPEVQRINAEILSGNRCLDSSELGQKYDMDPMNFAAALNAMADKSLLIRNYNLFCPGDEKQGQPHLDRSVSQGLLPEIACCHRCGHRYRTVENMKFYFTPAASYESRLGVLFKNNLEDLRGRLREYEIQ
jgi:hypothetical protein